MRPPRRCAAARSGRIDRRRRHVVHRAGVDAADERVDQACRPPAGRACAPPAARWSGRRWGRGRRAGAGRRRGRGRAGPRNPSTPARAVGQKRVGIPSAKPSGRARRRPRAHTDAPRPVTGTMDVVQTELVAQADRLGPPAEEPVGAHVDDTPTELRAAERDPRGGTTTRARRRRERRRGASAPPVSSQAAVSPLMPPPTTTTCPGATQTRLVGRGDHVGQHRDEGRVVVERRRARVGDVALRRDGCQLHVQVVEHLEVVGHEADRADHHRIGRPFARPGGAPRRARRGRARGRGCARRSATPRASPPTRLPRPPAGRTRRVARGRCRRTGGCARAASAR